MSTFTQQLAGMFTALSRDVIEAVVQQHNGNQEAAINALLAFADTQSGRHESMLEVIQKVERMVHGGTNARQLAGKFGLDVMHVAWEDNARSKGSCWGPCISDMTLNVMDHALPLVRYPNFEDLTWDVPMEKIPLVVGNEVKNGQLYTVTLKEYLQNFRLYLNKPQSWAGSKTSLLAEQRDSHVLMSAQACFLPVPKGSDATFNVSIYNYQSYHGNPAVLAIVATSQGTSAQVVQDGDQKLYFNKCGERASFIGQRLSDNRMERGVETQGEMSREEKQQNMIMIIQVPLKRKGPSRGVMCEMAASPCSLNYESYCQSYCEDEEEADVEDAIIKVGEAEGPFTEVADLEIERDPAFPVRVTLQFYKSTANGVADEAAMRVIASQIESARKFADNIGSLVVAGPTGRPTEHHVTTPSRIIVPPWWSTFWLTYGPTLSHLTEEQAQAEAFDQRASTNAERWARATLQEAQHEVLAALRPRQPMALPDWSVLG